MMHKLLRFTGAAVLAASIVLLGARESAAAKKNQADAVEPQDVCIPKSVEKKVTTCPGGFEMGKFKKAPRAKVGISTKKEKKKKKKGPVGPSLGRAYTQKIIESAFKRKREKKKIDILKREIELLKRLAKQTSNDNPEKAEVLKRIADAYKSFYDQFNYMARDLDEKIFQAKKKKNMKEAAKLKAQQKKLDKMARQHRELSIKAYVEIRNNFPDYPDYDEILFAIAYEIDQLAAELKKKSKKASYRERARVFYQELIRNFPRSRFIPHAWMAFGEYYFHEARDVDRAMKAYEKVVEWGEQNNPNYVVAMYYQAWCLFNMQEFQRTINQFNKVIEYATNHPENREAKAVAKRSRIELVAPFSKIGNPSQAWKFFQRIGGDLAHPMLKKLANLYYDDGHWADAIIVLHKLEALEIENYLDNNGDDLCQYQYQVTNAVISSRPKDEQVVELKRLLGLYKKYAADKKHDKQKVKKCTQDTTALAWDQATHWHIETVGSESAPGTKDRDTMILTIKLYDIILETFPNIDKLKIEGFDAKTKPTNYRVAYYKAELAWHMEDWNTCGPAFDAVVEMDPAGEYTSDAAYAAVLCYNKVYVKERGSKDKERKHRLKADVTRGKKKCNKACRKCKSKCKGKGKKECVAQCMEGDKIVIESRDLTELERGILKSYDRYVCYVAKGDDLVNIKYRRARIYYEANKFEEAAVLFKDIAVNHSTDELGVFAANLYLDCLNALGSMLGDKSNPACYDDLAEIVDIFIDKSKMPGQSLMKDEEFAGQIKSLKVGVLRKKAESLNKRGRFKEAAEVYLVIYRSYKGVYDERGMCEVLFNTAINMEAARLVMPAIKVREKMIELYPKCEHSKKAAFYIGQNYHALQVFPLAAENYQAFANKYPGEDEAPDALANAVMFYIGLGRYDEAWKAIGLFEKKYRGRRPAKAATVFFSAGYIHINEAKETDEPKAWESTRKHYNKYLKSYGKVKALDEQVQAHVFIGDTYWKHTKKPDYNQAEKSYKKAIAIFDAKGMEKVADNKRKAAMLNAAAKARFYVAERKFQEFKKVKFPEFNPKKDVPKKIQQWWDKKIGPEEVKRAQEVRKYRKLLVRWGEMKRKEANKENKKEKASIQFENWLEEDFKPWMEKKTKVLDEANKLFAVVVEMHVPEWEMAAAARAGDMQTEFMQSLYDAPLPPAFKDDQELIDIYRSSMDEKAQPFRDVAVRLFDHCLNVSTKVHWFNENSLRCEAQLNKLDPRKYPISEEIRTHPKNELAYWAVPKPVLQLETAAQRRDRELQSSADAISGGKN
ncbi:MAG: tetratricopeptide repeat protein [Proteobacteria bacterium]|nr:tetratricopeptide repeat protein [Pseudomonadota bacterium]